MRIERGFRLVSRAFILLFLWGCGHLKRVIMFGVYVFIAPFRVTSATSFRWTAPRRCVGHSFTTRSVLTFISSRLSMFLLLHYNIAVVFLTVHCDTRTWLVLTIAVASNLTLHGWTSIWHWHIHRTRFSLPLNRSCISLLTVCVSRLTHLSLLLLMVVLLLLEVLVLNINYTFLYFSQSFIQSVFAVSRDVPIDLGFIDICRLQSLSSQRLLVLLLVWVFTPPWRVHYSVNRTWPRSFLWNYLAWVRVFYLVALLCLAMQAVKWTIPAPSWRCLRSIQLRALFNSLTVNLLNLRDRLLFLCRFHHFSRSVNSFSGTFLLTVLCFSMCRDNKFVNRLQR